MIGLSLARNTNLVDASDLTKQNHRTGREKKLSHLGTDNGTEPGSDKPQPKMVRPMYVAPLKKNPDAQVDLPRTMMEQSEEWRNHNEEEWISYKRDQTIYSYTSPMSYGE
jgi:hypothetical protein